MKCSELVNNDAKSMHCIIEYGSTLYVGLARAISHGLLYYSPASVRLVTPHAQCERGKVIDHGVHIYIYIYIYMSVDEKNI